MNATGQISANTFNINILDYNNYLNFLANFENLRKQFAKMNPPQTLQLQNVTTINYIAPGTTNDRSFSFAQFIIRALGTFPNLVNVTIANCEISGRMQVNDNQITIFKCINVPNLHEFANRGGFNRLQGLRELYIKNSGLDDDTLPIISNLVQLNRLAIIYNRNNITIPSSFNNLRNMVDLVIYSNDLTVECNFSYMDRLASIELGRIYVKNFPDELIYSILRRELLTFRFHTYTIYEDLNENGVMQTVPTPSTMDSTNGLGQKLASLNAHNNDVYENINDLQNVNNSQGEYNIDQMTEGYDIIAGDSYKIINYLDADIDNIAIKSNKNWFLFNLNNIKRQLVDMIRFSCSGDMTNSGIYPIIDDDNVLINCVKWGLPADFISYGQFNQLSKTNNQYFEIIRTETEILSNVGLEYLFRQDAVSAAHCQDGQGGFLYKLYNAPVNIIEAPVNVIEGPVNDIGAPVNDIGAPVNDIEGQTENDDNSSTNIGESTGGNKNKSKKNKFKKNKSKKNKTKKNKTKK